MLSLGHVVCTTILGTSASFVCNVVNLWSQFTDVSVMCSLQSPITAGIVLIDHSHLWSVDHITSVTGLLQVIMVTAITCFLSSLLISNQLETHLMQWYVLAGGLWRDRACAVLQTPWLPAKYTAISMSMNRFEIHLFEINALASIEGLHWNQSKRCVIVLASISLFFFLSHIICASNFAELYHSKVGKHAYDKSREAILSDIIPLRWSLVAYLFAIRHYVNRGMSFTIVGLCACGGRGFGSVLFLLECGQVLLLLSSSVMVAMTTAISA